MGIAESIWHRHKGVPATIFAHDWAQRAQHRPKACQYGASSALHLDGTSLLDHSELVHAHDSRCSDDATHGERWSQQEQLG